MSLTEICLVLASAGADWTVALLLVLNVASVAAILERCWFFWSRRIDADLLARRMFDVFRAGNLPKVRAGLQGHPAPECLVLLAGLSQARHGMQAATEAMQSARTREQIRMQRHLGLLAAVGTSAPWIGLVGALLQITVAIQSLPTPLSPELTLASDLVAQALAVAAVGLLVGVPAMTASKLLERRLSTRLAQVESLEHLVLSQLAAAPQGTVDSAAPELARAA